MITINSTTQALHITRGDSGILKVKIKDLANDGKEYVLADDEKLVLSVNGEPNDGQPCMELLSSNGTFEINGDDTKKLPGGDLFYDVEKRKYYTDEAGNEKYKAFTVIEWAPFELGKEASR